MQEPGPGRRVLGAVVAFTLGLACAVMFAGAFVTVTAGMSGMPGMVDDVTVVLQTTSAPHQAAFADLRSDGEVAMSGCASVCADEVADVCVLVGSLAALTMLALLLDARRDTFLGLLARTQVHPLDRRHSRSRRPWTGLSLSSLCVLRI